MARYKIICRCTRCNHRWNRFTADITSPDPPCPRVTMRDDDGKPVSTCGKETVPIGMDFSSTRAPALGGTSIRTKAIDETAEMVMQDYGLTDMRDDVREGETASPKLPPRQQEMADNYFGGPKARRMNMPGFNPAAAAAAAMSGRLSDTASTQRSLGAVHAARVRPPVHIVNRQNS